MELREFCHSSERGSWYQHFHIITFTSLLHALRERRQLLAVICCCWTHLFAPHPEKILLCCPNKWSPLCHHKNLPRYSSRAVGGVGGHLHVKAPTLWFSGRTLQLCILPRSADTLRGAAREWDGLRPITLVHSHQPRIPSTTQTQWKAALKSGHEVCCFVVIERDYLEPSGWFFSR